MVKRDDDTGEETMVDPADASSPESAFEVGSGLTVDETPDDPEEDDMMSQEQQQWISREFDRVRADSLRVENAVVEQAKEFRMVQMEATERLERALNNQTQSFNDALDKLINVGTRVSVGVIGSVGTLIVSIAIAGSIKAGANYSATLPGMVTVNGGRTPMAASPPPVSVVEGIELEALFRDKLDTGEDAEPVSTSVR